MRRLRLIFSFAAINLLMILPAAAQDAEALRVVNTALATLGGEAKIRSFRSVYFSAKGFEDSEVNAQPFRPGKQARNSHEEKLAVFLDGKRLAYELRTDRGDGTTRHRRFYYPDSRRVVADFINKAVYASDIKYPSADRDQDARRIPHAFALEILSNASKLRLEGVRQWNGSPHEVVSVMFPNARVPIMAYFDKQTSLLSKYEFTADFPGLGESLVEYTFDRYTKHADLEWFPASHDIRIAGKVFRHLDIEAALTNSSEADKMLQLSPELEGFLTPTGTVKEIAKGVYFIYGVHGFQPMFIEFKEFVVAIEAPAGVPTLEDTPVETIGNMNAATDELIRKIRQTIPTKPIKYVVVTHGHADHFGGLRAFIPEKPTVLTSIGNEKYYRKFVPELYIESFEGTKTITDGERVVQLINVGRNPHTEENIVVYLPKEKFMFQGDLFYFNNEATFPAKDRMTVMPFFAKWLKTNGLAPERIYGFHSTMFGTMEHIDKILKLSAEKNGITNN